MIKPLTIKPLSTLSIKPFTKILCIVLLLPSLVAAQEDSASTWKGTLNAMGTKLRLEFDLKKEDGKTTGVLRSLDQANATIKLADVKLSDESLEFSVPKIGATFKGKLTSKDLIKGTYRQSGHKFPLSLTRGTFADDEDAAMDETLKAAWVGKLEMGPIKPVMQFRIVTTKDGETKAYFDSVTEGVKGLNVTKWSEKNGELLFEVAQIKLVYRGELNDDGTSAKGTWDQAGRKFPLTLKKNSEEYEDGNSWDNRPQKPVAPFPYDAEEVTFKNTQDDVTLAGTLTLPKGVNKPPVAILITGSGPQDRDETLMGHKPFLVLADYLSRNGIAVLRYDDRGAGDSTGDYSAATSEDFARDASAAVEFLKTHPKVDASKIGLCGHSEGGLIAPMVVGMRDDVAFIVMMAGTGIDGRTIVTSQAEAMSLAEGESASDAKLSGEVAGEMADLAIANRMDDTEAIDAIIEKVIASLPEEDREKESEMVRSTMKSSVEKMGTPWMQFFLGYDPAPTLEKVTCPTLSIIGSKDTQVLPDLNQPAIRKALEASGNQNFELIELPDLNHLFQKCETGGVSEYTQIQETMNPAALKKIGDWITSQTK